MKEFIKKEAVLVIAGILAVVSCLIIPPSTAYFDYINYRVLVLLFCLMSVVAGMQEAGFFDMLSRMMVTRFRSVRSIGLIFTVACFVMAMFLTNDVTLVTMVPFTMLVFAGFDHGSKHTKMISVLIAETVAANLGSMLTPFGNPQNLFLYSEYGFSMTEFIGMMLPYTLLSFVLVAGYTVFSLKNAAVESETDEIASTDWKSFWFYMVLFVIALLSVAKILDYRILLALTVIAILFRDRALFARVDYSLLLTFVFFFIFIGNAGNIPAIRDFLAEAVKGREMLTAVLASQVVSNVPAAILLAGFTEEGKALVIGTNLGGLGTLIASMASLITYKLFAEQYPEEKGNYLFCFTAVNIIMLVILMVFAFWMQ